MSVLSRLNKAYGNSRVKYNSAYLPASRPVPGLKYNDVYIKDAYVNKKTVGNFEPTIDYKLGYRHDVKNQQAAPKTVANTKDGHRKATTFHAPLSIFNGVMRASGHHQIPREWLTQAATNPAHYGNTKQSRYVLDSHTPIISAKDNVAFRAGLYRDMNPKANSVKYGMNPQFVMPPKKPFDYENERHVQAEAGQKWQRADNAQASRVFDKQAHKEHVAAGKIKHPGVYNPYQHMNEKHLPLHKIKTTGDDFEP